MSITRKSNDYGERRMFNCPRVTNGANDFIIKTHPFTRLGPKYQNHILAIDLGHDTHCNSRPYKMLTVMDEYTRKAFTVHIGTKLGPAEVLEALYPLIIRHGKPEHIRSNNNQNLHQSCSKHSSKVPALNPFTPIQGRHGIMGITNNLTAHCATKPSMPTGSKPPIKLQYHRLLDQRI